MKRSVLYIFIFFLFACSCVGGQSLSSNSNIDGIYVSKYFKAWKIYTENNNTFMECYTYTIMGDTIFKVEKRFDNGEFHLTLRSNNKQAPLMYGLIYIKDGTIYLDHSYFGANGTIAPIKKDGEYKKYNKQIYTKEEYLAFQEKGGGSYYHKDEKCFYILGRNYPKYEITKISIDGDFNITNIENGEMKYINKEFFININNRNIRYDDIFYFKNGHDNPVRYVVDLKINDLKNVGEKIYKSIYKFDSYEILGNSSGYENFLAQLSNSNLVILNEKGYIFKDMEIISTAPTATQIRVNYFKIIDDNVIKITFDYDWKSKYEIDAYYKR